MLLPLGALRDEISPRAAITKVCRQRHMDFRHEISSMRLPDTWTAGSEPTSMLLLTSSHSGKRTMASRLITQRHLSGPCSSSLATPSQITFVIFADFAEEA
jgi:hypothetical protein